MPQSLVKNDLHIIFSTKDRVSFLIPEVRVALGAYLAAVLKDLNCPAILVNCVADHVHILCSLSKNVALSHVLEKIKVGSSKWIKTQPGIPGNFHWQAGYGAFSVSPSRLEQVRRYIEKQEAHHRRVSFQEEYRRFLDRYGIAYDERYVWA